MNHLSPSPAPAVSPTPPGQLGSSNGGRDGKADEMAPCDVKSQRDVLQLRESVWMGRCFWLHVGHDGAVYISEQRHGEIATAHIKIPRRTFAAMVEWYLKRQA